MYPEKLYELSIVPNYPGDELTVVNCTILTYTIEILVLLTDNIKAVIK